MCNSVYSKFYNEDSAINHDILQKSNEECTNHHLNDVQIVVSHDKTTILSNSNSDSITDANITAVN